MHPPRTKLNYDLIAIDIDGTLIDRTGHVPEANIEAIARAREAGVTVLLCTGRNFAESVFAAKAVGVTDPMVTAGGSMVVDPGSGHTLHRFAMRQPVVQGVVEVLHRRGHAALVLKDRIASGFDYLVVTGEGGHRLHPVTEWWLDHMQLESREVSSLDFDEHPEWTVRVGACGPSSWTLPMRDEIFELLGEQVTLHSFPAVTSREHIPGLEGEFHILEAFDSQAHKWAGISWVCAQMGIDPKRTMAIGDEVNDVSMISGAGLGVAMGNAIEPVKAKAKYTVGMNHEGGVAQAISRVLGGEW